MSFGRCAGFVRRRRRRGRPHRVRKDRAQGAAGHHERSRPRPRPCSQAKRRRMAAIELRCRSDRRDATLLRPYRAAAVLEDAALRAHASSRVVGERSRAPVSPRAITGTLRHVHGRPWTGRRRRVAAAAIDDRGCAASMALQRGPAPSARRRLCVSIAGLDRTDRRSSTSIIRARSTPSPARPTRIGAQLPARLRLESHGRPRGR